MTQSQALDLLRAVSALERTDARIRQLLETPGAAPEWPYVRIAIDDRLRWLKYCLSLEDKTLVDSALYLLSGELRRARPESSAPALSADPLPNGGRVH